MLHLDRVKSGGDIGIFTPGFHLLLYCSSFIITIMMNTIIVAFLLMHDEFIYRLHESYYVNSSYPSTQSARKSFFVFFYFLE